MKYWLWLGMAAACFAADAPQAEISNGLVKAKLYLPDAETGYYRATRFDWAGVIASLEYKNHNYFGVWFERYDPKLHDAITGPVESFSAIGYDDAPVGGTFLRVGVGSLRKPQEAKINDFRTYDIVDSGKWTVKRGPDWIEFEQVLDGNYVYRKTLRLAKDKPELTIEHSLKNTSKKIMESAVFNHDFFMLDGQPAGPDFVVKFQADITADRDVKGLVETRGKDLVYLKELEKGQSVYAELKGLRDYDFKVENRKTGAGVHQTGDRPISKLAFWSIRSTVCPEAYNEIRVEPGQETKWRVTYEFY